MFKTVLSKMRNVMRNWCPQRWGTWCEMVPQEMRNVMWKWCPKRWGTLCENDAPRDEEHDAKMVPSEMRNVVRKLCYQIWGKLCENCAHRNDERGVNFVSPGPEGWGKWCDTSLYLVWVMGIHWYYSMSSQMEQPHCNYSKTKLSYHHGHCRSSCE